jgi:hypothetical protein
VFAIGVQGWAAINIFLFYFCILKPTSPLFPQEGFFFKKGGKKFGTAGINVLTSFYYSEFTYLTFDFLRQPVSTGRSFYLAGWCNGSTGGS